MFKTIFGRNI